MLIFLIQDFCGHASHSNTAIFVVPSGPAHMWAPIWEFNNSNNTEIIKTAASLKLNSVEIKAIRSPFPGKLTRPEYFTPRRYPEANRTFDSSPDQAVTSRFGHAGKPGVTVIAASCEWSHAVRTERHETTQVHRSTSTLSHAMTL